MEFKFTPQHAFRDGFKSFWSVAVTLGSDPNALGIMAKTAQATMRDVGNLLKTEGRKNIRAGGLSAKWANAWRVEVYPKKGASLNAAVYGHHNIGYSNIFEEGGTIRAKIGLLWIPLPTVPKIGNRIAKPRDLTGVKLFTINRGGKPILAAKIRNAGVNRNSRIRGRVSLPALRAGTDAEKIRTTSRLKAKQRGGVKASNAGANIVSVPLFVGVPSVTLRKRFNIAGVATRVADVIPTLYDRNFDDG